MDSIFKLDKDINCITLVKGTLTFGASDKRVYQEVERGKFVPVINHQAQVTAVSCLNGSVVSAGLDGKVRFADQSCFESQMPVVRCMSVSEDGSRIALGGPDGAISVHSSDGRLERHWEGHSEGTVYAVHWWGGVLFSSSADSDLKAWNLEKGKSKALARASNLHDDSLSGGHGVYCIDIRGRLMALGGGDGKASLWNLIDNDTTAKLELKKHKTMVGHTAPINEIKFDKSGEILATASNDKTICVWNKEGFMLRQNTVHEAPVLCLTWTEAGVYSGGADYTVKFTYYSNKEEPGELCCPISTNLMIDAVRAEDGLTYSRVAIEDWFRKGGKSSPLTNETIGTRLTEDGEMQRKVQEFIQSQVVTN